MAEKKIFPYTYSANRKSDIGEFEGGAVIEVTHCTLFVDTEAGHNAFLENCAHNGKALAFILNEVLPVETIISLIEHLKIS